MEGHLCASGRVCGVVGERGKRAPRQGVIANRRVLVNERLGMSTQVKNEVTDGLLVYGLPKPS